MGNCCTSSSSSAAVWAGDDWGPMRPERPIEKEGLLDGSSRDDQVMRIRISKKQLEELIRGSGPRRRKLNNAEQVLKRLIDKSHRFEIQHQRSWRPALQSIPEVN